jgi:two-component system copper resistance phosphate regulon response regulator CusR
VRILLVEDDPELSAVITDGLRIQHIESCAASDFAEGRDRALFGSFDVIVLDVLLPGGTGFDLCRTIRERGISTPILMLTARDAVEDRVRGLEAGADDYLTKPFAFMELTARLRALARRQPKLAPERYDVADLYVDLSTRSVKRGGSEIILTAKEFSLLEFLVQHAGSVVTRTAITAYVWDENHDPFTNVLEVLVRRLRRKIDDGFEPKLIHTLRGAGYRLGA